MELSLPFDLPLMQYSARIKPFLTKSATKKQRKLQHNSKWKDISFGETSTSDKDDNDFNVIDD